MALCVLLVCLCACAGRKPRRPAYCPAEKPVEGTPCPPEAKNAKDDCYYRVGSKCGFEAHCSAAGWEVGELEFCNGM